MLLCDRLNIVDPMEFYAAPRALVDMRIEHFHAESSGAYAPPPQKR